MAPLLWFFLSICVRVSCSTEATSITSASNVAVSSRLLRSEVAASRGRNRARSTLRRGAAVARTLQAGGGPGDDEVGVHHDARSLQPAPALTPVLETLGASRQLTPPETRTDDEDEARCITSGGHRLVGDSSNKVIADDNITASSFLMRNGWRELWRTRFAGSESDETFSAWAPAQNDQRQWIRWEFASTVLVTKLQIRGDAAENSWVTAFNVSYTADGTNWFWLNAVPLSGATDASSTAQKDILPPVHAKSVRIHPARWHGRISMRAEIFGCKSSSDRQQIATEGQPNEFCKSPSPLVGQRMDQVIPDSSITASSYFANDTSHGLGQMWRSRLDNMGDAWTADRQDQTQFVQWDLGQVAVLTAVQTKGRSTMDHWVSSYRLYFSLDGINWNTTGVVYNGNSDRDTLTERLIWPPITAQLVRLYPESWHTRISMRAELVGCLAKTKEVSHAHCEKNGKLIGNTTHKVIADNRIYVSSWKGYKPGRAGSQILWNARLDGNSAGWSADADEEGQWLGWEFDYPKLITKVETMGNSKENSWVTSFRMRYTGDGVVWAWFDHTFKANENSDFLMSNAIVPPIEARKVRIYPISWVGAIGLRAELEGCASPAPDLETSCSLSVPLVGGVGRHKIADRAITASSYRKSSVGDQSNLKLEMWRARLDSTGVSWAPEIMDAHQWLQWDFGRPVQITQVHTRGRHNEDEWVEKFRLTYSLDGTAWKTSTKIYVANTDRDSTVEQAIQPPITARLLKLHPVKWYENIGLRAEVFGCDAPTDFACEQISLVGGQDSMELPDGMISASSFYQNSTQYGFGGYMWVSRLDTLGYVWRPAADDANQWLQWDFRDSRVVTKVVTVGGTSEWVAAYKLSFRANDTWVMHDQVFTGNSDGQRVAARDVKPAITAQSVRLHPLVWHKHIALRADLYGCRGGRQDDALVDASEPAAGNSSVVMHSLMFAQEVIDMEREMLCPGKGDLEMRLIPGRSEVSIEVGLAVRFNFRLSNGKVHAAKVEWRPAGDITRLRQIALLRVSERCRELGTCVHLVGQNGKLVLPVPACRLEESSSTAPDVSLLSHAHVIPRPLFEQGQFFGVLADEEVHEYRRGLAAQQRRSEAAQESSLLEKELLTSSPLSGVPEDRIEAENETSRLLAQRRPRHHLGDGHFTGTSSAVGRGLDMPDQFDWRLQAPECLDYVHDQGHCGAGHMFAAIDAIADRHCINLESRSSLGKHERLSVQMALLCELSGRMCSGGTASTGFSYAMEIGLNSESAWPYDSLCVSDRACPPGDRGEGCGLALIETPSAKCAGGQLNLFTEAEAQEIETFEDAMIITRKLCQAVPRKADCLEWAGKRFTAGGLSVVFSADVAFCARLVEEFSRFLEHGSVSSLSKAVPISSVLQLESEVQSEHDMGTPPTSSIIEATWRCRWLGLCDTATAASGRRLPSEGVSLADRFAALAGNASAIVNHAFPAVLTGTCGDNPIRIGITEEHYCRSAAKLFGLKFTATLRSLDAPPGCLRVHGSTVEFNAHTESSRPCGYYGDCICMTTSPYLQAHKDKWTQWSFMRRAGPSFAVANGTKPTMPMQSLSQRAKGSPGAWPLNQMIVNASLVTRERAQCDRSRCRTEPKPHRLAGFRYVVKSEDALKLELMQNGPLYASFMVMEDFMWFFSIWPAHAYSYQWGLRVGAHAAVLLGWQQDCLVQPNAVAAPVAPSLLEEASSEVGVNEKEPLDEKEIRLLLHEEELLLREWAVHPSRWRLKREAVNRRVRALAQRTKADPVVAELVRNYLFSSGHDASQVSTSGAKPFSLAELEHHLGLRQEARARESDQNERWQPLPLRHAAFVDRTLRSGQSWESPGAILEAGSGGSAEIGADELSGSGESVHRKVRSQCWNMRNSWGSNWGDSGYFRMTIPTLVGPLGLAMTAADGVLSTR